MGLFQKKDGEKQTPERNPDRVFTWRLLAVGYIFYTVYKTFSLYFEGGEEMPEIWMLALSGLLGAAALAFGISSYFSWKKEKAAAEEARLQSLEAAEDGEEYAEVEDAEDPSEEIEE